MFNKLLPVDYRYIFEVLLALSLQLGMLLLENKWSFSGALSEYLFWKLGWDSILEFTQIIQKYYISIPKFSLLIHPNFITLKKHDQK